NASSACGEENRRIACSLNSLRMRRDCFQYASKTRRPKCLLTYKISPPELVFGKLQSSGGLARLPACPMASGPLKQKTIWAPQKVWQRSKEEPLL
ncbi:hypothetical protein AVEN_262045-1, partial [Araneus ventricosus]